MMVVDIIVGDASATLQEMEGTNCKLPLRLEKLQREWRQQKSAISNWASYFKCLGVSLPAGQSESSWIASCVQQAASKGPKYGGGKGEGKGDSKGKGRGKGNSGGKGWGYR